MTFISERLPKAEAPRVLIGRISCTVVSVGLMRIEGARVVAAAGASVSSEGGRQLESPIAVVSRGIVRSVH